MKVHMLHMLHVNLGQISSSEVQSEGTNFKEGCDLNELNDALNFSEYLGWTFVMNDYLKPLQNSNFDCFKIAAQLFTLQNLMF